MAENNLAPWNPLPDTDAEYANAIRQPDQLTPVPKINPHLQGFDPDTVQDVPDIVSGRRADEHDRYGREDGLETQNISLNGPELYAKVRGMAAAKTLGIPQIDANTLAAIALKEGQGMSGVFGVDPVIKRTPGKGAGFEWFKDENGKIITDYDPTQSWQKPLYDHMIANGMPRSAAQMALKTKEKTDTAARLGIPITSAWIGTGSTGYDTSADYAAAIHDKFLNATKSKFNKPLLSLINRALEDGYANPLPPLKRGYKRGGAVERTTHDRKIL